MAENNNAPPQNRDEEDEIVGVVDAEVYVNELFTGFKFNPSEEDLIKYFLTRRVNNLLIPINIIKDVNIYDYSPDQLKGRYRSYESWWYYFTSRQRKYPNGNRPNRSAGDGYWKATGKDKVIYDKNGEKIGYKKTLVFYRGNPPRGVKTNWAMHEYKLQEKEENHPRDMELEIVLARIYEKTKNRNEEDLANNNNTQMNNVLFVEDLANNNNNQMNNVVFVEDLANNNNNKMNNVVFVEDLANNNNNTQMNNVVFVEDLANNNNKMNNVFVEDLANNNDTQMNKVVFVEDLENKNNNQMNNVFVEDLENKNNNQINVFVDDLANNNITQMKNVVFVEDLENKNNNQMNNVFVEDLENKNNNQINVFVEDLENKNNNQINVFVEDLANNNNNKMNNVFVEDLANNNITQMKNECLNNTKELESALIHLSHEPSNEASQRFKWQPYYSELYQWDQNDWYSECYDLTPNFHIG